MSREELLIAYLAAVAAAEPWYKRWKHGGIYTPQDEAIFRQVQARRRAAWEAWIASEPHEEAPA
jgi:hypothetical protein